MAQLFEQRAYVSSEQPMFPQLFRINKVKVETHDTFTFELVPHASDEKFLFQPGQFNMLYMFGIGEVPISISGDPTKHTSLTHTIRAVGTVTKAMQKLKRGSILGVRGPFGIGWPISEAQGNDVLIIAGGIGLAPLRPSLYYILAHREKFKKVVLLYGTRTPNDFLYLKEIEQWCARLDVDVYVTVDRGTQDWRGNIGVVTTLVPKAAVDFQKTVAMICGPEIMMRFSVQELQKRGMKLENIFVSMERNMKCGIGFCGHCQYGNFFICKDGPVFPFPKIQHLFGKREL
jgi:NAD(P)H-flavin reductase